MWIEIDPDLVILLKLTAAKYNQTPTEYVNDMLNDELMFEDVESDIDNRYTDDGEFREDQIHVNPDSNRW